MTANEVGTCKIGTREAFWSDKHLDNETFAKVFKDSGHEAAARLPALDEIEVMHVWWREASPADWWHSCGIAASAEYEGCREGDNGGKPVTIVLFPKARAALEMAEMAEAESRLQELEAEFAQAQDLRRELADILKTETDLGTFAKRVEEACRAAGIEEKS
uniref:Uncharacterized protein n=1 Tax=viral metagenome TaxID=1070528 RepID=A0A6M3LFB0_9ZZZZ